MPRRRTRNCGTCGAEKVLLAGGASRCIPTLDDLALLLERQDGRCAVCARPWQNCVSAKRAKHEVAFLQYLCVDHDHTSGRVRGLLCNACNTAIGMFDEDPARFHAAVEYLNRYAGAP